MSVINQVGGGGGPKINGDYSDTLYEIVDSPIAKGDYVTTSAVTVTNSQVHLQTPAYNIGFDTWYNYSCSAKLSDTKYLFCFVSKTSTRACIWNFSEDYQTVTKSADVVIASSSSSCPYIKMTPLGNNRFVVTSPVSGSSSPTDFVAYVITVSGTDVITLEAVKSVGFSMVPNYMYSIKQLDTNKILVCYVLSSTTNVIVATYNPASASWTIGTSVAVYTSASSLDCAYAISPEKAIFVHSPNQSSTIGNVLAISGSTITVGASANLFYGYTSGHDGGVILPISENEFFMCLAYDPSSESRYLSVRILRVSGTTLTQPYKSRVSAGHPSIICGWTVRPGEAVFYYHQNQTQFVSRVIASYNGSSNPTITSKSISRAIPNSTKISPYYTEPHVTVKPTGDIVEVIIGSEYGSNASNLVTLVASDAMQVKKAVLTATGNALGSGNIGDRTKVVRVPSV